jgi:hypothetical protein
MEKTIFCCFRCRFCLRLRVGRAGSNGDFQMLGGSKRRIRLDVWVSPAGASISSSLLLLDLIGWTAGISCSCSLLRASLRAVCLVTRVLSTGILSIEVALSALRALFRDLACFMAIYACGGCQRGEGQVMVRLSSPKSYSWRHIQFILGKQFFHTIFCTYMYYFLRNSAKVVPANLYTREH